ncbi:hypothetical protein GPS57_16285 [Acinetobacter haemolyticus]|uniref:hypothetical protein n=1 Tax=Acinetobacter haemolyticus TaxID=29430 RepID=UPI001373198D|nr:hypothetical protein [Acinetobacter haemolyticus]NAR65290.1 hypothetical protein [Acinetobacter haemolyticus]
MRLAQVLIGSLVLFQSVSLYAESAKQCLKYWNEPVEQIQVLGEVECEHVWEFGQNSATQNRLKLLDQLNLKRKNGQWMSTGNCKQVLYGNEKYNIYRAYYKEDRDEIWIAYDNKNAFSYFRKIVAPLEEGTSPGVVLSCASIGKNEKSRHVLNSYLKKNTSVSMEIYRINDWNHENYK